MRIALINTPSLFVYGKINTGNYCSFPLGLGYIASYVRQHGHDVRIFDPEPLKMTRETLWSDIKTFGPDVVGLSAVTSNFMEARRLAREAREFLGCPVVMGGSHATALPKSSLLGIPELDAVIIGEGEIPVLEMARRFDATGHVDFSAIPGAAWLEDGELKRNPRPPMIPDIDTIPMPARDLVNLDVYRVHLHFQRGTKSATILSSRGCPSKCTFCGNIVQARKFRPHSPERFVQELEMLVTDHGIRHFHIVDDCFTFDMDRVSRICDLVLERKLNITWFAFGRVDTLQDEAIIQKMRRAGCIYILLGIETGSQEINDLMRKGTTLEMAERCCRLLARAGIRTFNSFIIGNEGDTEETVMQTIAFARKLDSVMAGFSLLIPFPGTFIFQKYYRDYDAPDTNWSNWCSVADELPYEPRQTALTRGQLMALAARAYRMYYLNPVQLLRILAFANRPAILLGYLKGAFGLARQVLSWTKKAGEDRGTAATRPS